MTNGLDFGLTQILFTTKVFFLTVIPAQAGIQKFEIAVNLKHF